MNALIIYIFIAIAVAIFIKKYREAERNIRRKRQEPTRKQRNQRIEKKDRQEETAEPWIRDEPKEKPNTRKARYRDKFNLLNGAEQAMYFTLAAAMPRMIVLSQVSMSQLFHIRGENTSKQLDEIGKKSVDFVVCRKDFSIVAAVELNGRTHQRPERMKSDATKRKALEEAGIPLIVFEPWNMPSVETIRHETANALVARRKYEEERNERLNRK